jgi:hypothetical protein
MITKRTAKYTCILACLTTLTGLGGCAAVDKKISLNYSRHNQSVVKHSGEVTVSLIESKPFLKNSYGDWIVGSLNNAYGVHEADLLADRTLGEWITEALLHELRQAGYTTAATAVLPASAAHGIIISDIDVVLHINKGVFSTDTRHELKFNVSIFRNGIKTKTFSVASRDDRTVPLTASKEELEKILLQSLQDALQHITPEIFTLIDKK